MTRVMTTPQTLSNPLIDYYCQTLMAPEAPGMAYLEAQGLGNPEVIGHFKLGYCDDSTKERFKDTEFEQTLNEADVFSRLGHDRLANCITIPAYDSEGNIVCIYGKKIRAGNTAFFHGNSLKGIINGEVFKTSEEVILCESVFTALHLYQTGKKNVIPLHNALVNEDMVEAIKGNRVKTIYLISSNNKSANLEILRKINVEVIWLPFPNNYRILNSEIIDANFKKAELIQSFASVPESKIESGPGVIHFSFDGIHYSLRGINLQSATHLKAVVQAKSAEGVFTNTFDLYKSQARSQFSFAVSEKLNLESYQIESHLFSMIEEIEKRREKAISQKQEEQNQKKELTEAEKVEALSFLKSGDMIPSIHRAFDLLGHVGEESNRLLCFFIGLSCKLRQPMSARIGSPSGLGKSFLMDCTAKILPAEDVIYLSRLSAKALYHLERNRFKNKLIIVDERSGSEEADYPLRSLLSENKLVLGFTAHDAVSGQALTKFHTVEGPIAYLESSTSSKVNPENASRSFDIRISQSPEQTRKIQAIQRKRRKEPVSESHVRNSLNLMQNALRMLQSYAVLIPFVEEIEFPIHTTQARRAHDRFLVLIESIAFLHQYQRELMESEGRKYIVAAIEDYALAYEIAQEVLFRESEELSQGAYDLLKKIREMVIAIAEDLSKAKKSSAGAEADGIKASDVEFRRRDLREFTGLPQHQVKYYMEEIEDMEIIEVKKRGSGSSHSYRLLDLSPVEKKRFGLIHPEELKAVCSGRKREKRQSASEAVSK